MKKRVSVVIPCYNHGEFLGEAIESAMESARADVEIILVDDGSTDERTRKEIERIEAGGSVIVIRQPNQGLAAARNAAIARASGEYILPLDSDNQIFPP